MKQVQGTAGVNFLECINPIVNKWAVRFDLQVIKGRENEVTYMEEIVDHEPSLGEIKTIIVDGIDHFDCSPEVNSFTVNGFPMWLDKQTRTSLSYTISVEEQVRNLTDNNTVTTRLWYNGTPPVYFDIPTGRLKQMLAELEMYAKATYDVTQSHKATIYALNDAETILSFDIRADYPKRCAFNL